MQNTESELAQKQAEQTRLRKAEKFMKLGTGQAECANCGYQYDPKKGDSESPVSPGTKFEVCLSKHHNLRQMHVNIVCHVSAQTCNCTATAIVNYSCQGLPKSCLISSLCISHDCVQNLPEDWQCPICGAAGATFQSRARVVAGFAENQGYGLGGNSLTSGQKSLLIYGSLLVGFAFFILGYFLQ